MAHKSSKAIRVLYTNGKNTYTLYSITHTGTDIYYGLPGATEQHTYHESGVKHTKTINREYLNRNREIPLVDVPFRQLEVLALQNTNLHFVNNSNFQNASGNKTHGSLIIDSRSIPENTSFDINVGLIAPDNLIMLHNILQINLLLPDLPHKPQQVLLYTGLIPWIYVILSY